MPDNTLDFLTDINTQATLADPIGLLGAIDDHLQAQETQANRWLFDNAMQPMDAKRMIQNLSRAQGRADSAASDAQNYYRQGRIRYHAIADDFQQQFPKSLDEDPQETFARMFQYSQTAEVIAGLASRNVASNPSVNNMLRAIPKKDKALFDQYYQAELAKYGERSFDAQLGESFAGGFMQAGNAFERLFKSTFGLADEDVQEEMPHQYELQNQFNAVTRHKGENVFETGAQAAIGMVPDITASVAMGTLLPGAGAVAYWWGRTTPDLQMEMESAGIDRGTARTVSAVAALPIALIEKLQVVQYFKGAGAGLKPAVAKTLAGWLGGTAKKVAITYGAELGEEAAQEAIELSAKAIAGEVIDPDAPGFNWDQEFENSKQSLYEAATAIPFLMGGGQVAGAAQTFPTIERVEEAERLAFAFKELDRITGPQEPALTPDEADQVFQQPGSKPAQPGEAATVRPISDTPLFEEATEEQRLEERREQLPEMSDAELLEMKRVFPENDPLLPDVDSELRTRGLEVSEPVQERPQITETTKSPSSESEGLGALENRLLQREAETGVAVPEERQPEFPQQPPKPAIRGKQTEISTPGTEKGIAATYAVMDLADLTPSHDFTTGRPKSNVEAGRYPTGLQPREYAPGSAEAEKVSQFVREGKAQFFISTHPAADSGPPSVTPDGIVVNGTGRVMTLQRAGKLGKFGWYKRELLNQAESFGIGKNAIAKMKRPVLVRLVDMPPGSQEAIQFARAGNVSTTQAQSPARTAAALSGLIDNEILDSIRLSEETTFSEAVKTGPQSKAFRSSIEGALPLQQRPQFFNKDGSLTESGTDLVRHMLLTKVLPVETIERLGENKKELKRTLEGAIPQLLKIRRDFASSDVTPQLNEALQFMLRNPDVQTVGQTNDLLTQGSLFGGKVESISPGGRMLLDFLLENGNRPRLFRKKLTTFLRDLTQGSGLFAEDLPELSVMASESLGVMRRPVARFGPKQQTSRAVREPKVHASGVPSTQPVSRTGAVAPFALQSAETTDGGKLLERLRHDSKRRGPKRVGPRSIVEFVNNLMHTVMLVGKTQTSKTHPAHFQRQAHIVRSRSGVWQINLHEAGHALSYLLKDKKPHWYKSLSPGLVALAQMQGSMASSKSAEEGMAELVRRYIVDYGSIPGSLREQFEAVVESLDPEIIKGLRDAHRAYQFQQSRPIVEQLESLQNDKPPKPPLAQGIKDVVYRILYNVVGGAPVLHRIHRRALTGIGGDTRLTKYDPTGLIGLAKSTVDGVYRSQQKLAQEFAAQVEDTPADFRSAYQSTIHIPQEVQRALYGVQQGREGIRVRATGEGFSELLDEEIEILTEGGFEIPTESVRHGNWIHLSDKSFSTIKHEVGHADWSAFVLYGQYKSALERHRKADHDYPGRMDGLTPQKLDQWITAQEQSHAGWEKQFRDVNKLMDQLLLVSVLSGEYTATEAVRIRTKWEDYWPLPRQIEDRSGRRSGGGAEPASGLYRAFGSPLPFRSLEEAVELRVKQALEAYYTNRMMLAVKNFGDELDKLKKAPFDVRKEAKRLMLPLHLETKKAATLKPLEEAEIIANGINRILAEQMGVAVSELPNDVRVGVEDVIISRPGRSLWRARKPNAVHVVAPFENGRRRYYQVPDPLLFDLFSQGKSPGTYFAWLSKVFVKPLAPWKRAITQNIAFAITNFVSRDPSTAMFMGKGEKSLIPYFYGTVGIINRIKGTNLDAVSESELLSKALDHTTRDAHRTVTDSFFEMLKEGIAVRMRPFCP